MLIFVIVGLLDLVCAIPNPNCTPSTCGEQSLQGCQDCIGSASMQVNGIAQCSKEIIANCLYANPTSVPGVLTCGGVCSGGYALKFERKIDGADVYSCGSKSTIPNCSVTSAQPSGEGNQLEQRCILCKIGYTVNQSGNCIAKNAEEVQANCALIENYQSSDCFKCKENYVLNSEKQCILDSSRSLAGCYQLSKGGQCGLCNIFDGYVATAIDPSGGQICQKFTPVEAKECVSIRKTTLEGHPLSQAALFVCLILSLL